MKINFIFYLLLLLQIMSCCSEKIIKSSDSSIWINDSISCLDKRKSIYYKIIEKKKVLYGKTKKNIEKYFGIPNIQQKTNDVEQYFYFVEKGQQCFYSNKNGYDTLNVEVLFFFFDKNGKVINVGGMKP